MHVLYWPSSLEKCLCNCNFEICFHFKDNEELRVICPVPAEDEQTDCTSAQQLSTSTSPPCAAELSALRYKIFNIDIFHIKITFSEVSIVAQQVKNLTVSVKMWVQSPATLSGLRIQHCCKLQCRLQMQVGSSIAVAVVYAGSYSHRCGPKKKGGKMAFSWHCHRCDSSYSCDTGLILDPRTSACLGCGQ